MDTSIAKGIVDRYNRSLYFLFGNQSTSQTIEDCRAGCSRGGLEIELDNFKFGECKFWIPDQLIEKIRLIGVMPREKDQKDIGGSLISMAHTGYLLITYVQDDEPVYYLAEGNISGDFTDGVVHMSNVLLSDSMDSEDYEESSDKERIYQFLTTSKLFREIWIDPKIISDQDMFEGGVYTDSMVEAYFKNIMHLDISSKTPSKRKPYLRLI